MKTKHELELIDGTYSASDANEILMNLLSDKIKFHQLKNFSSSERLDKNDHNSLIRISELEECKKQVVELVAQARESNQKFTIHSQIIITLHD
jgi:hypothetical protein